MKNPRPIIDLGKWLDSPSTERIANKKEVLSYLKSYDAVAWASPYIQDPFAKDTVKLPEMAAYTDGEWCWDSADVYFFEMHDAKLNPSFLCQFTSDDGGSKESFPASTRLVLSRLGHPCDKIVYSCISEERILDIREDVIEDLLQEGREGNDGINEYGDACLLTLSELHKMLSSARNETEHTPRQ